MSDNNSALGILARHVPAKLVSWAVVLALFSFFGLVSLVITAVVMDFEFKLAGVTWGRDSGFQSNLAKEERVQELIDIAVSDLASVGELNTLSGRVAGLESNEETSAMQSSAIPEGAVVAFDRICPEEFGWRIYSPATSRFIVGAGIPNDPKHENWERPLPAGGIEKVKLPTMRLRESGGAPEHTLHNDEVPAHRHTIDGIGNRNGSGTDIRADSVVLADSGYSRGLIETIGNGYTDYEGPVQTEPHTNMPPYIPLYFCINAGSQ